MEYYKEQIIDNLPTLYCGFDIMYSSGDTTQNTNRKPTLPQEGYIWREVDYILLR